MTYSFQQSEAFVSGSKPLGYYGLGSAGRNKSDDADLIIDDLQEQYGTRLECMERLPKMAFRAALVCYLYQVELWAASGEAIPETLIHSAIDRTCSDLWTDEPGLCYHLQEIATLDSDRIESLILALTAQLRHDDIAKTKGAA